MANIKNSVIQKMHTLNGTGRGYYALETTNLQRRKRLEEIALYAVAKAIQDAFSLQYLPACGECD